MAFDNAAQARDWELALCSGGLTASVAGGPSREQSQTVAMQARAAQRESRRAQRQKRVEALLEATP